MSTFAELRKNSQAELEKLSKEATRHAGGGGFEKDARYWRPIQDTAGNGSALIRFLPRPNGEESPFVKKFSYGFKGPTGKWFIENSPQTIGLPCPTNERWAALWAEGTEEAKERAKLFKRRMSFISNVVVIKHPARPEDEGKVFLYEYGKRIWDKLNDKMNPSFPDVAPFNPFDPDTGANFRLRVMKKDGFTNYDKSEFDAPAPFADDVTMERVWGETHSLAAEIAPDKFKPYGELKAKLMQVLGEVGDSTAPVQPSRPSLAAAVNTSTPPWPTATAPAATATGGVATTPTPKAGSQDELDWFKSLAGQG